MTVPRPHPVTEDEATQPTRRSRTRRPRTAKGWKSRWMASVPWPFFLAFVAGDVLLLAVISVADLAFIKASLDPILGQAEAFSWAVATTVTLLSVVLAVQTGRYFRKYWATAENGAFLAVLGLAWLGLGLGMFWLRWTAGDQGPELAFEGAVATSDDSSHHLIAGVLLFVYVATGASAFFSGWALTNPVAWSLRTARFTHNKVQRLLPDAEADLTRLHSNLKAREADLAEAAAAAQTAKESRRAVAAHVQAVVRGRIAQHLGDPSAAGVTRPHAGDILPPA